MSVTANRSMPSGVDGSASIGAMLRAWRRTRRTSQLDLLDLALHASVSQKHLSFIESGRANPRRDMILRLADSLSIPLREQNVLLAAAGFTPHFRERSLDVDGMAPVRLALETTLNLHEPYPAIVVNRDWDMFLANGAMHRILALVDGLAPLLATAEPVNTLKMVVDEQGLKPYIQNCEEVALHMLQRLQREAAASGSARVGALLDELRAAGALPSTWYEVDWTAPPPPVLPVTFAIGDVKIRLFSMIATFGTPMDLTTDELRLETFFRWIHRPRHFCAAIKTPGRPLLHDLHVIDQVGSRKARFQTISQIDDLRR